MQILTSLSRPMADALSKRHPDFRLFLTMDPVFGEISRPMRNRCIEISFLDPMEHHMTTKSHDSSDSGSCFSSVRFDCLQLLQKCGITGSGITSAMFSAHARAAARLSHGGANSSHFSSYLSLRHLKRWGLDVASRVRRGEDPINAICGSFVSLYPGVTVRPESLALSGAVQSLSEVDILLSELQDVAGSLDQSMIATPGIWPHASALTSSSFLSVDSQTQRDLGLTINTLQCVLAGALKSISSVVRLS